MCSVPWRLPQPCTVRHLVESYLDISAVPRRSFFELLSTMATNELEQEKLLEFSSAAGQEELYSYCHRPRRTALEVRPGQRPEAAHIRGLALEAAVYIIIQLYSEKMRAHCLSS